VFISILVTLCIALHTIYISAAQIVIRIGAESCLASYRSITLEWTLTVIVVVAFRPEIQAGYTIRNITGCDAEIHRPTTILVEFTGPLAGIGYTHRISRAVCGFAIECTISIILFGIACKTLRAIIVAAARRTYILSALAYIYLVDLSTGIIAYQTLRSNALRAGRTQIISLFTIHRTVSVFVFRICITTQALVAIHYVLILVHKTGEANVESRGAIFVRTIIETGITVSLTILIVITLTHTQTKITQHSTAITLALHLRLLCTISTVEGISLVTGQPFRTILIGLTRCTVVLL